jgi:hypothetical protein
MLAKGPDPPVGGRREERSPAEDLLIETFGLILRLDPKFALEDSHAELVLVESGPPPAQLVVEAHQRAVHRLLERIERDKPEPGPQGRLHGAGSPLGGQQRAVRLDRQLAQPLPLGHQPLFELGLLRGEPGEQVAAIDLDRLLQRLVGSRVHKLLEMHRVDVDAIRVQGDGRALHAQASWLDRCDGTPEREEGLAKAVAGPPLREISPEQRGQLVARVLPPWGKREVGEKGLGLPGGKRHGWGGPQPGLKPTEDRESEPGHETPHWGALR